MDTTNYLDIFIDESREHLEVLYKQVLNLEKRPDDKEIIEEIFRAAHTLKGMAATMGFQEVAQLTHKLENIFDGIRYEKVHVYSDMIDILFQTVDDLSAMLEDIAGGGDGKYDIHQAVNLLDSIENNEAAATAVQTNKSSEQDSSESKTITELNEFDLSILKESNDQGYYNYEIVIRLHEDCLLKGARAFMVFSALEKLGEIVKSNPSVNDLEEENFDNSFSVLLLSQTEKDEVRSAISTVSEIEDMQINLFSLDTYNKNKSDKVVENEKQQEITENTNVETKTSKAQQKKQNANKTIRVDIERLDILMNLFEELVIDRGRLEKISSELNSKELQETVERMTRVSGDLQNIILTMRMVPVDQVFNRFPRMIRKLSRDLKKDVEVEIAGAETELDRTVIDEIGDPLVHLIRNAMDHGIESPDKRKQKNKTEQGTIRLQAYHSGNHVFIEINDDGAGINKEAVLQKAIDKEIITKSQADTLTDEQVYALIMDSGFSTADSISDISGRGVGLDVVKNTIESLGGSISIDSEIDEGTTFLIQLPLTLSIISVLLVQLQEETYAIPLSSIVETAIINREQILYGHHQHVIDFRDKVVPLIYLNEIFDVPALGGSNNGQLAVVIVRKGDKMAGLVVDSFIEQQEVVLKSLGDYLSNTFAISGATILGDGQVALIIDSNAFLN